MTSDADRKGRASNYILGLMDEAERERAERDLEMDPAFRDAVVEVAERMHLFDLRKPAPADQDGMWSAIAAGIAEMPHMAGKEATASSPASDSREEVSPHGWGLGGRRGTVLALSVVCAFALGYLTGVLAPP